jgi:hypothetical protein
MTNWTDRPNFGPGGYPDGADMETIMDEIEWQGADRPCCLVTRSVAQTGIVTGTPTAITFDTEVFDNASMFTASSDTITVMRAGIYAIHGYVAIESNATGYRRPLIEAPSGLFVTIDARPAVNGDATHMTITAMTSLTVGQTVKLYVDQTSGANRSTAGTPRLGVYWVAGT